MVEEVSNGQHAISLIHKIKPELVVTDIRMPVLDGLGLIKMAVQEEENQPKFIIISGYSDFTYAQTAVRYGVHDFILKPIDKDEMESLKTLSRTHNKQKILQEKNEELNWKLLTHSLTRKSQLNMVGNPDSGGVWAPCLSYHAGTYYLIYSDVKSFKDTHNYMVTAQDIMCPWSEPIFLNCSGFDPSLFHDNDGRKWLVNMV